jgi:hypothetical protein
MKYSFALAALALKAAAFPAVLEAVQQDSGLEKRVGLPSLQAARDLSAARTNCGPLPCVGWDPKNQYVSTHGDHAYRAPAKDEIRGMYSSPATLMNEPDVDSKKVPAPV